MSGKLKIIRVLSNPIRKRTKKKKAPRRRRAKSAAGKFVLRVVSPGGKAFWKARTGWTALKGKAQTYATEQAGREAWDRAHLAKKDWIVADVLSI